MRIHRLAMPVLLLGFLAGRPVWGQDKQDKVQVTEQITAVKGKITLELAETTTLSPELETEFSGFFQDLVEELKKQTAELSLDCRLNLIFDLQVKKRKSVVITVEPPTGNIFQYLEGYIAKDPADEKPYKKYLAALAERILKKYIRC